MKMEAVKAELEQWGELIVTTAAGDQYELHLGDTQFDFADRVIRLTSPKAQFVIAGDSIENIQKHYGHKLGE